MVSVNIEDINLDLDKCISILQFKDSDWIEQCSKGLRRTEQRVGIFRHSQYVYIFCSVRWISVAPLHSDVSQELLSLFTLIVIGRSLYELYGNGNCHTMNNVGNLSVAVI